MTYMPHNGKRVHSLHMRLATTIQIQTLKAVTEWPAACRMLVSRVGLVGRHSLNS